MDQLLGRSSEDKLAVPRSGGRSLRTDERSALDLSHKIKGWSSDLDPATRPGVPRDKAPEIGAESLYIEIDPQPLHAKVMKSTEHGRLPPVLGTSCPPRGLSGMIRDVAFKFSEGRLSHWMLLMFADRVDVVEGVLLDLAHLRVPNVPKEMGLATELRYNRKGVAKAAAIGGLGLVALMALSRARSAQRLRASGT